MQNSIYLTGWEYNRLLKESPCTPVSSGLPAQVLWDGCAQFWLFERVYCTRESLSGDRAAYEALGWTTGRIFEDLERRGFLTPVDWKAEADSSDVLAKDLKQSHEVIRQLYSADDIRQLLVTGDASELEAIKLSLISPLLHRLKCVNNISPNSLGHWIESRADTEAHDRPAATAAKLLGSALSGSRSELRAGFELCRPPGTGLDPAAMAKQHEEEQRVQRPMIPALLAGDLPQSEYHARLHQGRDVYRPVNAQLWADYRRNVDDLERVRDIAKTTIWPRLHHEWLPRLDEDPEFLPEFRQLIAEALRRSKLDPYLQLTTDVGIITLGGVAGAAVAPMVGTDPISGALAGSAATGAVRKGLEWLQSTRRKKTEDLVLFFQKARKILKDRTQ